jgi:hypothetical protein
MHNSKLIHLLRTFNKKEIKDFSTFIRSEYFNKNKQLIDFTDHILKYYPDFDSENLEKEMVHKALFPKLNYDEPKMRHLMSDLTILIEEFIRINYYQSDEFFRKYFLLRSLKERKLDKYFKQNLEDIITYNQKQPFRDSDFYFNQYLIEETSYEFTSERRNRSFDISLQEVVDNLEFNYLSKSLKYYCEMVNRSNILSVNYNLNFFGEIIKYLLKGDFNDKPAIKIYLNIYQSLIDNDNQDNYFELLEQLNLYSHLFKQKEQRDMFVFAQNYCIRRINGGYSGAIEQMFELYQMMVEKKLIYEGRFVSQPDFKNIVTVGLRLNKIDWVEEFIETFKNDLNPDFAENAIIYSYAWIHFARKEYDKALKMLLKVEFNDVYYHLDSKSLLLKVYYEMNEFDGFFSLVDAFRIYLKRNKFISDTQRNTYHNFVNLANKLMKIKSRDQKFTQDLIEEINNTKPLADLQWLQLKASGK